MVTISNSTLRHNVYETVYDTLKSANLLSGQVTVTAAYIDDDEAFPQVVVHPVDVSVKSFGFDRDTALKSVRVVIDIWTKKNEDKDKIADEISSLSGLKKIDGLMLVGWDESNAFEAPGRNKLHLKTMILAYERL